MDANNRVYTTPIEETIESLYYKNDKIYMVAYTKDKITFKKNYLLYNQDGKDVLSKEGIDNLKAYDKFLIYTKDKELYIINYDGEEVMVPIKLYLDNYTYGLVKPYTIRILDKTLVITIPQNATTTHLVDEYYYNMDDWSLIRSRKDVRETS